MNATIEGQIERRRQIEQRRRIHDYPGVCPTCFSVQGERCISIAGKPVQSHIARLGNRNLPNFLAYPAACPVCQAKRGQHCVSLHNYTKKVHTHDDRPSQ